MRRSARGGRSPGGGGGVKEVRRLPGFFLLQFHLSSLFLIPFYSCFHFILLPFPLRRLPQARGFSLPRDFVWCPPAQPCYRATFKSHLKLKLFSKYLFLGFFFLP